MIETKGDRTRAAILDRAARLATVEGLEGLTIGGLAAATGISKSGLYAHFGSKETLQLATIEAARDTFMAEVVTPALAAPRGVDRLRAACDAFLNHVERRVFPGGCFFAVAAAEVGTRPGLVHDAVAEQQHDWLGFLERLAAEAGLDDPGQVAFELNAMLVAANTAFILHGDPVAFDRARTGVAARAVSPR